MTQMVLSIPGGTVKIACGVLVLVLIKPIPRVSGREGTGYWPKKPEEQRPSDSTRTAGALTFPSS
jgi:hypothetical protein